MTRALADLALLAIDCQASGASPAHGDLLEIGWALCGQGGLLGPVEQRFVIPRTERRVPAAVRELTGWSEACLAEARPEQDVWQELRRDMERVAVHNGGLWPVPAAIHYARFELPFLTDLHARLEGGGGTLPIDVICVHAIAARLFPDLPRRNIRALAGYLGHSTELMRRSGGHVEATAFIWRSLVPRLAEQGVLDAGALAAWLKQPAPPRPRERRSFPLATERRRALPDAPGVYRFLRSNGDVLYVGKAASIKKRVASHFSARASASRPSRGPVATTERVLELLTQVQDLAITVTPSILEAALLESDEIKRIDPPYNVQLRSGERSAWFASRDLSSAASTPDPEHPIGPLSSEGSLLGLRALIELASGADASLYLQACALSVPISFLPDEALFRDGFQSFSAAHLTGAQRSPRARVAAGARALWLARGRSEAEPAEDLAPDAWDLARVVRRLERSLTGGSLVLRRARWLALLAHADVAFQERGMSAARAFVLKDAQIIERNDLASVADLSALPARRSTPRLEGQRCFDATAYDRMRVLATELNRIHGEGGALAIRCGARILAGTRLTQLLRWI